MKHIIHIFGIGDIWDGVLSYIVYKNPIKLYHFLCFMMKIAKRISKGKELVLRWSGITRLMVTELLSWILMTCYVVFKLSKNFMEVKRDCVKIWLVFKCQINVYLLMGYITFILAFFIIKRNWCSFEKLFFLL